MTAAGRGAEGRAAGGQRRDREIEVEEVLPGHLDYRDGQGRAFHVWTITTASKYGLGKVSEDQLRELDRQIHELLGPAAAGSPGDQWPRRLMGPARRAGAQ
jgi:hypothetical protein